MNWKRHSQPTGNKLGRCGATGKVIFRTDGAAKKRIKEILTAETNRCHDYLRAFQCNRCGYWHLTSKPNERQPIWKSSNEETSPQPFSPAHAHTADAKSDAEATMEQLSPALATLTAEPNAQRLAVSSLSS